MKGEYEARDGAMVRYLERAKFETSRLKSFEIQQIPRPQSNRADALSKLASSSLQDISRSVFVDIRRTKSVEAEDQMICSIEGESSWMDPIIKFKLT